MRLVIVQYAGDYAETFKRLAGGDSENYYAQKYSVDAVTEMAKRGESVTVICCITPKFEDRVLENGVRAIGCGFNNKIDTKKLIELIAQQNPTHLVMRTTIPDVFKWAIKNKIRTIAVFAESIATTSWRNKIRNYFLANLLNNKQIEWVGTYGITSSLLFKEIGVKHDKIIPWDFLLETNSGSFSPKELPADVKKSLKLFYAGLLVKSKGVGDILEAVAKLRKQDISVHLKMAGKGEEEFFDRRVEELQIKECVEFLGMVPTPTLEPLMRESDVVLVTSRHEYPEGFPLTIQHALRARTPIVASDHPMFKTHLKHSLNAMIFEAGNSLALAKCLEKLISDSALYHNLSVASHSTWDELRLPVKWAELIDRWLDDSPESKQWLFEKRLASEYYNRVSVA
ncbi:glycosyltransferase family 4 protein [Microcoleus sp. LEGE 07076]|uniref:glycosyltransferase family 4 protein n=1 Tax=Microcoleus sp. LEGE 07076 TaxID=915322 RepID=UPI0018808541|nr:glycosyltransferase family 4 protein [Microcoleus sp. LEGE 07076]MBE9187561.1 glycosyltransferase family 4 protein [Microcoleus sp. LEGE 07076]